MKQVLRMCVGCREMKDKKELIRVVKKDVFSLDETGKMHGRGAYICKDRICIETARKKRGLEKSLKENVPAEVYDELFEAAVGSNG